MGHRPYVIRFATEPAKSVMRRVLERLRLYNLFLRVAYPAKYREQKIRDRHDGLRQFGVFRSGSLAFSGRYYKTLGELRANPPQADCYIVGSDQVWSQSLDNVDNEAFFLNFGSRETGRIAYAPSFGFDAEMYPKHLWPALKRLWGGLDAVSCRERNAVAFCRKLGQDAVCVLDPTFLLDSEAYHSLASGCGPLVAQPYVFIYSLNIQSADDIRFQELTAYMDARGLGLVVTPADGYCHGGELFGSRATYSYATIGQWLSNIIHSSLVVTSSFHGIALSVVLRKAFVYVPLTSGHSCSNSRVLDMLESLGLEDRTLTAERTYEDVAPRGIDWEAVGERLNRMRKESLDFLTRSILKTNKNKS